jgi:hypothetical protein
MTHDRGMHMHHHGGPTGPADQPRQRAGLHRLGQAAADRASAGFDPTPSVEVGFDGWMFPKAGVAFVWVLDEEVASLRDR